MKEPSVQMLIIRQNSWGHAVQLVLGRGVTTRIKDIAKVKEIAHQIEEDILRKED